MTSSTEAVAARWLDPDLDLSGEIGEGPTPHPGYSRPTIIRDVWVDDSFYPTVWRPDPILRAGVRCIDEDHRGRYRVTCDDGVRRRLTIQQLRGEA